jgi:hypothetical protein
MLELSNFKGALKIDFSSGQPGRHTSENLSLYSLTRVMLSEVCNYFVTNLLCKTVDFVDDK